MVSPALILWRSSRLPRLDRLLAAHPQSPGSGTAADVSEELTHALVLRLASEFQGFSRDLHDDSVAVIAKWVSIRTPWAGPILTGGLIVGRGLDRRSADPETINGDFARVKIELWAELSMRFADSAPVWREMLRVLHQARNGGVHDDRASLTAVEAAGSALRLETVRQWRNVMDEVVSAMDSVVSTVFAESIGIIPWPSGG